MSEVDARKSAKIAAAMLLLIAAACLFVAFFEHLPIEGTTLAMDWRGLWVALQGGVPKYQEALGLRIPPWCLPLVLPLGLLSFRASWGLLVFVTFGVLVASVPRSGPRMWRLGALLLTTSFLALRQAADGNFEALVIAGTLLALYGYGAQNPWILATGILLATAKPQETWLLVAVLAVYVLRTWAPRKWLVLGGTIVLATVPGLVWLGRDWLSTMLGISQRGSIMDSSLSAAVGRLGLPIWVFVVLGASLLAATLYIVLTSRPAVTREKAGMLIAASLLLSPYATGNSFLTVLAVGIIPLLQSWLPAGVILVALADLPYLALFAPDVQYRWSAYYWTAMLIVTWGVLAWHTHFLERGQAEPVRAL